MEVFQMKTTNGDGLQLKQYDDFITANALKVDPARAVRYAKEFKYRPGDIIICTYPKCGSHWLLNIISRLKSLDNSKRPRDTLLEYGQAEVFDTMDTPRIIWTHLKPYSLPVEHIKQGGKIVLMLRNPKDAMVSRYYHYKDAVLLQNKQTWEEFFYSFIHGLISYGSYFDYVRQWELFIKEKQAGLNFDIFYFEDFKSCLRSSITRLNEFLGFNRDQKYIMKVIEATTLSALRMQDSSGKRGILEVAKDEYGDSIIYRKGQVGDWKNYLTVEQNEVVDKLMVESLKYGFIKVKYEI